MCQIGIDWWPSGYCPPLLGLGWKRVHPLAGRIGLFSGIPLLLGFASGPAFYYINKVQHQDLEPALMYTVGAPSLLPRIFSHGLALWPASPAL